MAKITISQISIENLGPFRERQIIDLSVQSSRPVILIKALNGSGKTTLLTALQIGMYGFKAINTSRRSEYDQLITGLQRQDAIGNSIIEMSLLIEQGSTTQTIVIHREWSLRGNSLQEHFYITSNGTKDLELSENWDEFINGILPVELVQLFLFDGEKIEALANPERLPDLLRRATEVFLGLGGIDSLTNDLKAVERRALNNKKLEDNDFNEIKKQAILFESQLSEINEKIALLAQRQAGALVALDEAKQKLEKFSIEAQRIGLNSYQKAAELKSSLKSAEESHSHARNHLVNVLEDPLLPLIWLGPAWLDYKKQWQKDYQANNASLLAVEFAKRDQRILQLITESNPSIVQKTLSQLLEQDLIHFKNENQHEPILLNGENPTDIEQRLSITIEQLKQAIKAVESSALVLDKTYQSIGQIPAEEQISTVFDELQVKTKVVSAAEIQLYELSHTLEQARSSQIHVENRLNSLLQRVRTEFKENALTSKALQAASRAKKTLEIFRERLLASKAIWLSTMITYEFQQLLRKKNLISQVLIDPQTYTVSIQDFTGHILPMERLSAGERQLLAISVLSALIRERKGRFPVVVDTPLARLDRKHREALIHSFFSKISHQVLVLSTDEEVEGSVYASLHKHMSKEYELNFDDSMRYSIISEVHS